ncbi:phosphate signaling complex protein PhoU [Bacillus taeanensis]|uniref:Phosphate-specific transport system accessory protein PhoU n=1 Tax=Bacillus taeanensis TaxID=273032 RepID=A0A366XYA1_9BACI|nr:phosphate signaling complex protein PhoU [Bacillus taeanensis]RBW70548.1 phosphate transport system regulatory protein PhoU [Bacillus taeanensis]
MSVRENFDAQLKELKDELLELGNLAQNALKQSIIALKNQDVEKALQIIENDYKINNLESDINDKVILMIAKQQPVATDLRRLIVALKISTDLERIGDLAVNIAKSIIRIGEEPFVKPIEEIPKMAETARGMIKDVLQAFYDEDVVAAKNIADSDDEVDQKYGKLIKELLEIVTNNPEWIAQITQLTFICRFIERAADHATNISESVIYLVKGKYYDLNS